MLRQLVICISILPRACHSHPLHHRVQCPLYSPCHFYTLFTTIPECTWESTQKSDMCSYHYMCSTQWELLDKTNLLYYYEGKCALHRVYSKLFFTVYQIHLHWEAEGSGYCNWPRHKQAKIDKATEEGFNSPCEMALEDVNDHIYSKVLEPKGIVALVLKADPIMTLYKLAKNVHDWSLCPDYSVMIKKLFVSRLNAVGDNLLQMFRLE